MSTFAAFRTTVMYESPSPLGLGGGRWVVNHTCTACGQELDRLAPTLTLNAELVRHAETCKGSRS